LNKNMLSQSATAAIAIVLIGIGQAAADDPAIGFTQYDDRLVITAAEKPLAIYHFSDKTITRPFFSHVHAPRGPQVSRNHPPQGNDIADHASFHPGIWLTFGDISGNDYWRLKAKTEHVDFVTPPSGKAGRGEFAVRNRYLSNDGKQVVCEEIARYTLLAHADRVLLVWDSTFSSPEHEFALGDQEEMGLGVRMASGLSVAGKPGGRILNNNGHKNEKEVWGKQAAWCDYGGALDGRFAGITVMPHPDNFRASWFHARDYGLLVANPFGQRAFGAGQASRIVVKPGENFRLRFGLLMYCVAEESDLDREAAYREYVEAAKE
jgi:hypothetical protein